MRVSQEEMDRNHQRIVEGAARLVRERGIDNTSVADVMSDAGLTHGGFYRHFKDKEAMVAAALQSAFDKVASSLEGRLEKEAPQAVGELYRNNYLSKGHVERPGIGCPVAALGGEVGRATGTLKTAFGAGVNRIVGMLARTLEGSETARKNRAMRELAMLAGAVMIARASDPETGRRMLAACRLSEDEQH